MQLVNSVKQCKTESFFSPGHSRDSAFAFPEVQLLVVGERSQSEEVGQEQNQVE